MSARVLSIQSHVTYGYVGGKAAVFPLQCLGYDVDAINTVNFSNHSGYGRFGGSKATADELTRIFDTMEANGLLTQDRILTGYIPGAEALLVIANWVKKLKTRNPNLIYLLDPVLGDSGKLYVAADVIPIYRDLLPCSTIITPNWFEVETLTDIKLDSMRSLRQALRILHEKYRVPNVVMSSMPLKNFINDAIPKDFFSTPSLDSDPAAAGPHGFTKSDNFSKLICISSSYIDIDSDIREKRSNENANEDISVIHAHILPCIPGYFSGVGDLFSALVLAHFHPSSSSGSSTSTPNRPFSDVTSFPSSNTSPPKHLDTYDYAKDEDHYHTPLSLSTTLALTKTFSILKLTDHLSRSSTDGSGYREGYAEKDATDEEKDKADPERRVRRQRARELRLVQGSSVLRWVPRSPTWRRGGETGEFLQLSDGDTSLEEVKVREMRVWKDFWKI